MTAKTRDVPVVDTYALSPTQEGMLFHGLSEDAAGVDIEQIICCVSGAFVEGWLLAAFDAVASRHAILRTRFAYDVAGRPIQEVLETVRIPVRRLDLTGVEAGDRESHFEELLRYDRAEQIDLGSAPAMRLTLTTFGTDEHRIVWTFHHALLDGRSFPLVLREVFAFYDASARGRAIDLPLPRPYREYIKLVRGLDLAPAQEYWTKSLAGFSAPTPLVVERRTAREPGLTALQGVSERRLGREDTARLRAFATARAVTLNTLLQAAWALLLHRYSGETDIVFGATRACRRSAFPDAGEMVGLFINTLPLRIGVDPDASIDELLARVRARQVELRAYEHTPLAKVQGWSEVPRGRGLFDSILVYEERTLEASMRDLRVHGTEVTFAYRGQTNYPLTVVAYGDDEMLVRVENDRRYVADGAAARMLDHLLTLLNVMPDSAGRKLHDLPLGADEPSEPRAPVQVSDGDRGECVHERFEGWVRREPGRVAVVCGDVRLSYGELDGRANALAWRLRALGVGPGTLVGLRVARSVDVVVGIVGVLKAGGAYVPLDPAYPADRVAFMVEDSQVGVVVAGLEFVGDFRAGDVEVVVVDDGRLGVAEGAPPSGVSLEDLAYVMYTSGSTGTPKGVMVSHRNVSRLFDATQGWFGFRSDDVWSLFHSYAFDFSVWELWGALVHGARVVVVPYWVSRSPEAFWELVVDEQVTVLNQTPSAFRQLIQAEADSGRWAESLRWVVFGGEALEFASLGPWMERHGDQRPRLVNMYGITETTVHVTYRPVSWADVQAGAGSVIGLPLPDLQVWVLDAHGQPVPTGVAGEMVVGGAGVTGGYWRRPELTAQRFVVDRFGGDGRLYRSGDLARRLESGELEYLGRIDDQVKIRGFRIELGEIEAALGGHPRVREAAVVVREDRADDKRLVAYVASDGDDEAWLDELKTHLKAKLPNYMVPAHLVRLARLPLTPNGKIDRNALPAPDVQTLAHDRPYQPPRTPTEASIADIWADVLGMPRVSVDDSFFELGGDSILTIQVIARCRQAGLRFSPRDLAKHSTIRQLAEVVHPEAPAPDASTELESPAEPVMATPIQLWFLERRLADPSHWNQAFLFEVPPTIDIDVMEAALRRVVTRHDAFHLRVTAEGLLTSYPDPPAPSITPVDLAQMPLEDHPSAIGAAAATAQGSLDLEVGSLVAAMHFDRGPLPGRLLLVIHHLAIDAVSWGILLEDLELAYRQLRGDPTDERPPSASFKQWSRTLRDHVRSTPPDDALARWTEIIRVPGALPDSDSYHGDGGDVDDPERLARSMTVSLRAADTQALLQRVPSAYRTRINDVLLTALALTLREWSGRDDHRIDLEGHGREESISTLDVLRTVGWFTALYPVALDLEGAADEGSALKRIKEQLRWVPDAGVSYGLLRYASEDPAVRERLAAPAPDLLFNYLGQLDQVVAGTELFRFADEPTGAWHGPTNQRTHRLEVLAAVSDGRLRVQWTYGAGRDKPEVVERLAHTFISRLRGLIEHCTTSGAAGFTPSDFPLASLNQPAVDALAAQHSDLEDVYPLSPMQALFLSMDAAAGRVGFEQWVFRLRGPLDPEALREAWELTAARHAMLRTAFLPDGAWPVQIVERHASLPWRQEDWCGSDGAAAQAALTSLLDDDRQRSFDLRVAPLSRVTLVRLAEEEHTLVWSTHHLYVDGWSWPLIFRDVAAAYEARLQGAELELPRPCQYGEYIGWLSGGSPDSRQFWNARLRGFTAPTPIAPRTAPEATATGAHVQEASRRIAAGDFAAIEGLARARGVTVNTLIQCAWALLLSHLSGQDEVVFGAAFSGRPPELPGVETLVGPCVNNLPIRARIDADRTVSDWLQELHEDNLELAQHQYASLADIQRWAGVPLRLRLFDSLVVFQNYLRDDAVLRWGTVEVEPLETPDATNYPLTLTVTPGAGLQFKLAGRGAMFGPRWLTMLLDGVTAILSGLVERRNAQVGSLRSRLPASTWGSAGNAPAPGVWRSRTYAAPSDQMERRVAAIWKDLFQADQLGADDNFFDLGGHSILLVEAHARLCADLGRDLAIVTLLQYPTIRTLARQLSSGETSTSALTAVRDRAKLQREALARRRRPEEKQ